MTHAIEVRGEAVSPLAPVPARSARLIRVMVVDDHELVRAGIVQLLSRALSINVVAVEPTGEAALEALDDLGPDVVLLDYRLPGMSGAATCREILRRRPSTAVVILTGFADDDAIRACLAAGARGYLLKDTEADELIHTITTVARGEAVLARQVTAKVVGWAREGRAGEHLLTLPETDILSLVAHGLSNGQIAERLHVSIHSVKLTLRGIMRRLEAATRSEAAAIGIRKGLI